MQKLQTNLNLDLLFRIFLGASRILQAVAKDKLLSKLHEMIIISNEMRSHVVGTYLRYISSFSKS